MGCGSSTPSNQPQAASAPQQPVKQEPPKAAKPGQDPAAAGDSAPPELVNGIKNFQPLFCHHGDFYISCHSKDGSMNFAVCESSGCVYHIALTDKQVQQHNDLKAITKWPAFFNSLNSQFQAHSMRVKVDKATGGATLHLTTDGKKSPFNLQLEKKGVDAVHKHKFFLEPLIQHHMRIKTDKALEALDNKSTQLEINLNTVRLSVADGNTKLKTSEQEIDALRSDAKKKQLAIQELKDSCAKMSSKLRKLRDPSGLPDLYAWRTGPKRFALHHPILHNHDPVMKQPNVVALAAIKAKYARDQSQYIKKDDAPVHTEAFEDEFQKALSAAKDPRSHEPILQMLQSLDDWAFDVFAAETATGGQALLYITYALFHKYGLCHHFNLDDEVLVRFLSGVQAGYHPNPFHNSTHAADVVQCMHFFISPGGMKDVLKMSPEDCFAALMAACIHDFDHPGVNNNFHARTRSYLGTLYNDRSTLENHACASVFDLIKNEPFNIFSTVPYDSWKNIRESILETVLNTDLGVHFRVYSQFKKKVGTDGEWGKLENMRLALSAALKAADISNVARPTPHYAKWAKGIAEEFYNQGDLEHQLGLAVTPFFVRARHKTDFVTSQEVFFKHIAQPLFDAMGEIFPNLKFCSEKIQANKEALNHDGAIRAELQLV